MPNPSDASSKIQEQAQSAVKAAKERFDTHLDYSEESLPSLDRMLTMAQHTFDQQRVEGKLSEEN